MDRISQAIRLMVGFCLLVVLVSVIGAGMGPEHIDFRNPPREYETVYFDKWTVFVEKQLRSEDPAVARRALARMKVMLPKALAALPEHSRANLRKLPIYLMYGPEAKGGGHDNRLEYFPKDSPKHGKYLDPRWSDCVVIYCADYYVSLSDFWALKALVHEFAHAYHLEQWPANQPDILRAWNHAVRQGLYRNVRGNSGEQIEKAYALKNQMEYFAELSCAYFFGCEYQPFTRKELKAYDPVGYAMIQKMWRVRDGDNVQDRQARLERAIYCW